jgi:hypothetical protein
MVRGLSTVASVVLAPCGLREVREVRKGSSCGLSALSALSAARWRRGFTCHLCFRLTQGVDGGRSQPSGDHQCAKCAKCGAPSGLREVREVRKGSSYGLSALSTLSAARCRRGFTCHLCFRRPRVLMEVGLSHPATIRPSSSCWV